MLDTIQTTSCIYLYETVPIQHLQGMYKRSTNYSFSYPTLFYKTYISHCTNTKHGNINIILITMQSF